MLLFKGCKIQVGFGGSHNWACLVGLTWKINTSELIMLLAFRDNVLNNSRIASGKVLQESTYLLRRVDLPPRSLHVAPVYGFAHLDAIRELHKLRRHPPVLL